jgi:hypothetical protein
MIKSSTDAYRNASLLAVVAAVFAVAFLWVVKAISRRCRKSTTRVYP